MIKKTKNILIIVLIIGLVLGGFFLYNKLSLERRVETLSSKINENLMTIKELATAQYNYTNIAEYKNSLEFSGLNIPFTSKTFLVKYSGYLKAGLTDIDIEIAKDRPDRVEVRLGEIKILDNVINEEDVYFYNEKDSGFNRLKFDDLYDLLIEEKEKQEEEIKEAGFLEDARLSAENTIAGFLRALGFQEVVFI